MGDDGFVAVELPGTENGRQKNTSIGEFQSQPNSGNDVPGQASTVKWLNELDHITIMDTGMFSLSYVLSAGSKGAGSQPIVGPQQTKQFRLISDAASMWHSYKLIDENQAHLATFRPASLLPCCLKQTDWMIVEYPPGAPIAKTCVCKGCDRYQGLVYRASFIPNEGFGSDHVIQEVVLTGPFDVEDINGRRIGTVDPNTPEDLSRVRVCFSPTATPFDKLILVDLAIFLSNQSKIQLHHWLFILLCTLFIILVTSIFGPWFILLVIGLAFLLVCFRWIRNVN